MTLSMYRSNIQRLQQEIGQLQKQLSDETKKEADKQARINQVKSSITKNTSLSTLSSKNQEVARLIQDIAQIQGKQSDINKKLADRTTKLHKAQQDLAREEERLQKKATDDEKRRSREQLNRQKEITRELEHQKNISTSYSNSTPIVSWGMMHPVEKQYDVFISHASEDKDDFVRPLAEKLQSLEFNVWYDEFTLKVGDSLRRSIDKGLANARYGIVILSSAFIAKQWTQYELDGLVAREINANGQKVILPIWHKVTKDEVIQFSPSLADKLAINSMTRSIEEIADELAEVLREK